LATWLFLAITNVLYKLSYSSQRSNNIIKTLLYSIKLQQLNTC